MKKGNYSIFVALILMLQSLAFTSANNYNEGWKQFNQNNRKEARKFFNLALNEPEYKADALLSLSYLDWTESKESAAFSNFVSFYNESDNPYPYYYAMNSLPFFMDEDMLMSPFKLAFYQKILQDKQMHGTMRAMVNQMMGTYYRKRNQFRKAQTHYDQMGVIKNWQVLGTFDNTSESGFSKDWGAVNKSRETDVFKNKVNAEVSWYNPVHNSENNWFKFDYYFNLNSALMYAQSFVTSDISQQVYMRVGTSGSLKVWVNDALMISVPEERNCDLDIYVCKVDLNQGANRILVQIGSGEIERANFMLRLTDKDANPIPNISGSATYADYTVADQKPLQPLIPFFAEAYFEEKIKSQPENPINYLLLSETFLRNDKAYEAIKVLKHLEKITDGGSTLISYRLHEGYIREKNQVNYKQEMERIKNNDPESVFSLIARYSDLVESEKYDEAENILNRMIELYGENEKTDEKKLAIKSMQKRYDEVISMARQYLKKYPDKYSVVHLNYIILKDVDKKPAAALKLLEKYSKKNYNESAQALIANHYFEYGNIAKGMSILQKRIVDNPYATGYLDHLISILNKTQQYNLALRYAEQALKLTPYLPYFYSTLGNVYKNMNQPEKAKEQFRKAIYYAPNNYDARTELRLLESKQSVYELFPKVNLTELIASAASPADYPDDNSLFLLNSVQRVVYPEGAKEYRRQIAIKILKQTGIERWKEYGIGYNGHLEKLIIDKAEVIKANGSVVKAETYNNQIVFTSLEVNDVLHLEYRVQDFSSGLLSQQFFDKFLMQYSLPSVKVHYSLLVPNDKTFRYVVTNGDVEPQITEVENMKLYSWEINNQPKVKSESYLSDFMDIAPTLHYSSMPDWEFVSNWYRDVTTSKFNADYVLKETFRTIMEGNEQATQEEKARLIYNYILENISYSSVGFLQSNYIPQKASRTITTRLGDCKDLSTLFVALCREAGIDANLVLILTRDNGHSTLALPEIGFNHCIAQLNLDDKSYYLELTDNFLPFGAAIHSNLNAEILPVPLNQPVINGRLPKLEMSHRLANSSERTHRVSLNNNDMMIKREIAYTGLNASWERGEFRYAGADDQLKSKSEDISKQFKVPARLTGLSFRGLEDLSDTVYVNTEIEVKNAAQDVAGMKIFALPWTDINSLSLVSLESRTFPLDYWSYQIEDYTTETIILDLPAGRKLAEVPEDVRYECPTALYTVKYDLSKSGKVIITRYFKRKQDYIQPQDYPAFREFLHQVSEYDHRQIAIR